MAKMFRWNFLKTLHFRIAVLMLALLTVVFLGYTWWVEHSEEEGIWAPGEEAWYDNRREAEDDSLAVLISPMFSDSTRVAKVLDDYDRSVRGFDAEVAVILPDGRVRTKTRTDTLSQVLKFVSPALLDSMSLPKWDFGRYPNPDAIDAYENRINDVIPIHADGDSLSPPVGWLVSSFRPVQVALKEIEQDERRRKLRGGGAILLSSFLGGLMILAWVSRRIQALQRDMSAFRDGAFDRRARGRAGDEIGSLERSFNSMADHLTALIDRLRQSESYRRQLVANISHDLRTPMASLRGYVESLTLQGADLDPQERDRHLKTIASNLDNLEGLIERLFELTQLESGQMSYKPEVFSLEELAGDVLQRLEVRAREGGVELRLEAPDGLPLVEADPLRIGQVLQNLVDNAVKFNRPGGSVTIAIATEGDGVGVEVRDTGFGIDGEDLPHVFERFYTADKSRTGKDRGAGLGLAIAHQIVTGHGGQLTVEQGAAGGAVFRFALRAARSDWDQPSGRSSSRATNAPPSTASPSSGQAAEGSPSTSLPRPKVNP